MSLRPLDSIWLEADWAATGARAGCSLRGGEGGGLYGHFNLATHVGDDPTQVAANRQQLVEALALPAQPLWLQQNHGVRVVRAGHYASPPQADAAISDRRGEVLAVLVADCLPILLSDPAGDVIAAVHAGWRGLVGGIIERTVNALRKRHAANPLQAWLGPCIGPRHFEVGPEVRAQFVAQSAADSAGFVAGQGDRWMGDLRWLATRRLRALGVERICGAERCTVSDQRRFYSYRREASCGRMAALVWH